jgi:hypothetical protein
VDSQVPSGVAAQNHGRDTAASWARFWMNPRGWRLNLRLTGAGHNSFSDVQVLIPQIAGVLHLPSEVVQQWREAWRPSAIRA